MGFCLERMRGGKTALKTQNPKLRTVHFKYVKPSCRCSLLVEPIHRTRREQRSDDGCQPPAHARCAAAQHPHPTALGIHHLHIGGHRALQKTLPRDYRRSSCRFRHVPAEKPELSLLLLGLRTRKCSDCTRTNLRRDVGTDESHVSVFLGWRCETSASQQHVRIIHMDSGG